MLMIYVIITKNFNRTLQLKDTFGWNSVINNAEQQKMMPFLDVLMRRTHNAIPTCVSTNPTNYGDCINLTSSCSGRYKVG